MDNSNDLYILWTSADPITAEKMVFMYGLNSLKHHWWDRVTIIVWGAATKLVAENTEISNTIEQLMNNGVNFSACKACADQLGVSGVLEGIGIEVKFWGEPLTQLLKSKANLLSV
jgi:hypothetical protein